MVRVFGLRFLQVSKLFQANRRNHGAIPSLDGYLLDNADPAVPGRVFSLLCHALYCCLPELALISQCKSTRVRTKILIVEDQFIEANNMRLMLKDAGYAILSLAASVSQALEILQRESPDLVLVDIHLEGEQTGIDLASILKSRGLPFVYLSANSD